MWRSVIDWILEDIYPFDQAPLEVEQPSFPRSSDSEVSSRSLVQAIGRILGEHEQLVDHARELESRRGESEEMERHVKGLLPVVDAMERVLDYAREAPPSEELTNWLKSVEGVYYRLVKSLEQQGLEPLSTVGKPVDLNCQEVVEYIPSKEHGHDRVVSERQKGYRFRGKLIRDAKVVVAYNP